MKTSVLTKAETAFVLRTYLGPIRSWSDTLADMARHKTEVAGLVLLPVCRVHDGRAWRPAYRLADVVEFIRIVREHFRDAKKGVPPAKKSVDLDPSDHRHWRLRKLTTMAKLTAMPSSSHCLVPAS